MTIQLSYPLVHDRTGEPKPRVTQVFGARKEYYAQFGLKDGHEGEDYGAYLGQSIFAAADGQVVFAKPNEFPYHPYGIYCRVYHGGGYETAYCHLSRLKVSLYQEVKAGQEIGLAGTSGNSDGVHLHLNLIYKNSAGVVTHLNPALYYGTAAMPTVPEDAASTYAPRRNQHIRRSPELLDSNIAVLLPANKRVYLTSKVVLNGGYRWIQLASPQTYNGVQLGGTWLALDYTTCKTDTYGTVSLL